MGFYVVTALSALAAAAVLALGLRGARRHRRPLAWALGIALLALSVGLWPPAFVYLAARGAAYPGGALLPLLGALLTLAYAAKHLRAADKPPPRTFLDVLLDD